MGSQTGSHAVEQQTDEGRFLRILERTRRHLGVLRREAADRLSSVRELPLPRYLTLLAIKSKERVSLLRMEDVDWLETAGNYIRLHSGRCSHLHREALVSFEPRLDPRRFVRIHRSMMVNIDRVAHLEPTFRGQYVVILRDGTRLTMSAPYRSRLQTIVGEF